jgi:hypothetical protein
MSQKQSNPKTRVTLSKASKRLAATILDDHKRGAFIRSQLDAENTAFMSRFSKPSRDSSDSN